MNKFILLALAITAISCEKFNWAVLVAGSNGYGNYRHQSDICHAYHILTKNGMDPNHIIVMAYDDIADNYENPIPGKIFNRPDGEDVYEGCKLDYTGDDVTPQNFVKILTADTSAPGRVLESTEKSNVFIYFSDHGAEGLIAFPYGELYADEYHDAMIKMHDKKLYNKCVFYLEACESGSMFNEFPEAETMNLYQVSASSPYESSWACYCGSEAVVGGINIGSCLGDEFSCRWMENSDAVDLKTTTLAQQKDEVTSATEGSQVMDWGDLSFKSDFLIQYQGDTDAYVRELSKFLKEVRPHKPHKSANKVKASNAVLAYLKSKAERTNDQKDWAKFHKELKMHKRSSRIFREFRQRLQVPEKKVGKVDFNCYRRLMHVYKKECGFNIDRDHSFLYSFYNYCSMNKGLEPAYMTLKHLCHRKH